MSDKNPYKYGSIEHSLYETKCSIEKNIELINKSKIEEGVILPVQKITFYAGWLQENPLGLENKINNPISSFFSESTYRKFDENIQEHLTEAHENCIKWIEHSRAIIEAAHQKNIPFIENNIKVAESIHNFMKFKGIDSLYSVWENRNSKSKNKEWVPHSAGFLSDIERVCITGDGYKYAIEQLNLLKRKADEWLSQKTVKIQVSLAEKKKKEKELLILAKSLELAKGHNLTWSSNEDLIKQVQYLEEIKFLKENGYDEDDEDVEGNVVDGFYIV